jgi:hypothetical protein
MKSNQNLNLAPFQVLLKDIDIRNIARIITTSKTVKITKDDEKSNNISPSKLSSDTSSKIEPIDEGDGLVDMLAKIYGFMKQTNTDKIKRLEKENNFKEEQDFELLKKHEELINAIKKLRQSPTATPMSGFGGFGEYDGEDGSDSFDPSFIPDGPDRKKTPKNSLRRSLRRMALPVRSFLRSGLGKANIAAMILAAPYIAAGIERKKIEENPNAPEIKDTPYSKVVRGEAKTQGEAAAQNQRSTRKEVRASEIKEALETKPAFPDVFLLETYGMDRNGLTEFVRKNPNGVLRPDRTNIPKPATPVETKKETDIPKSSETTNKNGSTTPTAQPVSGSNKSSVAVENSLNKNEEIVSEQENASVILNRVTKTNIEAKMESKLAAGETNVVNNQIVNSSSQSVSMSKSALPAVRNLEATYQRMIYDSTRIV